MVANHASVPKIAALNPNASADASEKQANQQPPTTTSALLNASAVMLSAAASEKQSALRSCLRFNAPSPAKRAAKAARQAHLDFYGPNWTINHEAEFQRWCDLRTRHHRLRWTGDPNDLSLGSYDACEADQELIAAEQTAIKELRATGDSEAAAVRRVRSHR